MMSEPWFGDPNAFGAWYGTIVGGVGGSLIGVFGGVIGRLAPQGRGRRAVLGTILALILFGALQAILGLVALLGGQPYGIWYPLLLCGGLFTLIFGGLLPAVRRAYDAAEQRRIEASGIRNG